MGARTALALAGLGAAVLVGGAWYAVSGSAAGGGAAADGRGADPGDGERGAVERVEPVAESGARDAARPGAPEAHAATSRVVGRVVDERDAGVEGAWLTLERPARGGEAPGWTVEGETGSARDGTFAFEVAAPEVARVRAEAPYGWRIDVRELPAPPPPVFRARIARRAPLRIALVDAETDEPVPDAHVAVRPVEGGGSLELVTDADGAAASELELGEGELLVALVQEVLQPGRTRRWQPPLPTLAHRGDPDAPPDEVRAWVGPTLRLDLRLPAELDTGMLHAILLPPGMDTLDLESRSASVRVREGADAADPWVRFPWDVRVSQPPREGPCTLVVRDNALGWRGTAQVHVRRGVHPARVTVALQATCELEIAVRGPGGTPLQGALVEVRDVAGRTLVAERTGVPGDVRFAGLPAGEYTLATAHREHLDDERALLAPPGGAGRVLVVLEPAAIGGAISGRVVARERLRAFADVVRMRVRLLSRDVRDRQFELPLVLRDAGDGRWTAEFRFDDVPAGRYECRLSPSDERSTWPTSFEVSPPAHGLVFAEHAPGELLPLRVEAFAAEGGARLEDARLWARGEGHLDVDRWADGEGSPWLPQSAEVEWAVGAAGHSPRFGDRDALRVEDGMLAARVTLQPGFGLRLELVDPSGTPLTGVAARIDGAAAGASDASGRLVLAGDAAPASLELEHPRWRAPDDLARRFAQAVAEGVPHLTLELVAR